MNEYVQDLVQNVCPVLDAFPSTFRSLLRVGVENKEVGMWETGVNNAVRKLPALLIVTFVGEGSKGVEDDVATKSGV